jgi:hypothetical protein
MPVVVLTASDKFIDVVPKLIRAGELPPDTPPDFGAGIKHHLLRLARIGANKQHAAIAKPDVSNPHGHRHAVQQDDGSPPASCHISANSGLAPGTGLQSPETWSQNLRCRDLSRRQRPHVAHLNSRKCRKLRAIRLRLTLTINQAVMSGGS